MKQEVFTAVEMEPGFFRIEDGGVRCFLIEGDDRAMLIDTGFGDGDLLSFVQSLTKLPVFVVNTHADGDHIGCNEQFVEIWMHPAELDYYAQKGKNCETLHPLWEGDIISLGKRKFEILLIPGHTPGSIALFDREHGTLISGDSLQKIQSLVRQVLPSHGDLPLSPDTITKLAEVSPKLLAGEYTGKPDSRGRSCMEYDCGIAKFLY